MNCILCNLCINLGFNYIYLLNIATSENVDFIFPGFVW